MALELLKKKVESVNFPVGEDEEYKDDSNEILKSISIKEEKESDSDYRIFVAYLSLISSVYFGEKFISNILLSFTLTKLTRTKINCSV